MTENTRVFIAGLGGGAAGGLAVMVAAAISDSKFFFYLVDQPYATLTLPGALGAIAAAAFVAIM